jgi:hypothetical protein
MKTVRTKIFARRIVLVASGLLAIGVGGLILTAPDVFYAAYDIEISNTSLVNELKAPAGVLLAAGLIMLLGAFRDALASLALTTAATVYLGYGLTRLLSMAVDGVPHSSLVSAAVLEISVGAIAGFFILPEFKKRNVPATLGRR